jgi:hypothetical protein
MGFEQGGEKNGQDGQRNIFPVFQEFRYSKFSGFDLNRLVLDPAERTDPPTDSAPKQQADSPQESQEKERDFADGREMLKHSDGTRGEGSRTGMAIQTREAHLLQWAIVDLLCRNNGEVTIWKDKSKKRDDR